MMLGVTGQDLGDSAIVRCVGRIVIGQEIDVLRKTVLSQARRTVVDLTMYAIDDSGIGLLVSWKVGSRRWH